MREALDEILQRLDAPFLTTAEWNTAARELGGATDNVSQYRALRAVLLSRGGEGDALTRLTLYFRALGVPAEELGEPKAGFSNIFIGAPL